MVSVSGRWWSRFQVGGGGLGDGFFGGLGDGFDIPCLLSEPAATFFDISENLRHL